MSEKRVGVAFPAAADGNRSTTGLGRTVVADALAGVDPLGSKAAAAETGWRSGYPAHLRRAVEAGLGRRADAVDIATRGLDSLHDRMTWHGGAGEIPLAALDWDTARPDTQTMRGTKPAEKHVTVPYRGGRLEGRDLDDLLERWEEDGIIEPSVAIAVRTVQQHPEWLQLKGFQVAVLGAGAEMGPLRSLLRWGATVAAVDLPLPQLWRRVQSWVEDSAGTVIAPLGAPGGGAGLDICGQLPELGSWVGGLDGRLVLGNYVYADAAENLRLSTAVDALSRHLLDVRPDTALAFLATPTDVFGVGADAVAHATRSYAERSRIGKLAGRPLRAASAGRLLRRNYPPDADPGINDSVVPQQGPNYLLAKRVHRWRAAVARDAGGLVSMNVAPPTRTRSVVKNRALAAAYAGAHRFGVEVFEPATANTLMAVLLVHDLHTGGGPERDNVWADEAWCAVHGGLWRAAYAPRSALGLAALMGYGASRA